MGSEGTLLHTRGYRRRHAGDRDRGGAAAAFVVSPVPRPDGAGVANEVSHTHGPDPQDWAYYGSAAAVSGKLAVVGGHNYDSGGFANAGRADVYRWNPGDVWVYDRTLALANPATGANETFGTAAVVDGSELLVSAPGKSAGPGTMGGLVGRFAYDPSDTNWYQVDTMSVPAGAGGSDFGISMAKDGSTLVIGAQQTSVSGVNAGSVFVYTKGPSGWVQTQRLDPGTPQANEFFGCAVAVEGDVLVVGARGRNTGEGTAYIYRRLGGVWTDVQRTQSSDAASGDWVGSAVAVCDGTVVVGNASADIAGLNTGAAYTYRWNGSMWAQGDSLVSPSPSSNGWFGSSLAASGGTLLVGAPQGGSTGQVFAFRSTGSSFDSPTTYMAGVPVAAEKFGSQIAFDGQTAIVGAEEADGGTTLPAGGAYFFNGFARYRTMANYPLTIAAPGVLFNDAGGSPVAMSVVSGPSHGTLVLTGLGAGMGGFTYSPKGGYTGADSFTYRSTNSAGTAVAVASITVVAPTTPAATSITIARSTSSVRYPKAFVLSGVLTRGAYLDPCVVYVKKPGSRRWSYSSARLAYSTTPAGGANWWYRYTPKLRGYYYFYVRFAGDSTRRASQSGTLSVRVR
jgi:hypothetical protein